MKRKIIVLALSAMLFAFSVPVWAQQPTKIPRIGFLSGSRASANPPWREALRQGLRELGYEEGKNIVIEWRYAEEKSDRVPKFAAELVHLKVDVIVGVGSGDTGAARAATATTPIVTILAGDPGYGFVASLARPGGNVTGFAILRPELTGKRLELLKEIVPKLSRVAVFGSSSNTAANARSIKETELAAAALGVKFQYIDIIDFKGIEPAFQAANKGRAEAVLMLVSGPVYNAYRTQVQNSR
jgi:putative ABC transport system substrate-binding protein